MMNLEYTFKQNKVNGLITTSKNENGETIVLGRDLHEFLEVGTKYSMWIKRMIDFGFAENIDYILLPNFGTQNGSGGHNKSEYVLKMDMAKHIAMVQRSEKGMQARQYFIDVEKQAKDFSKYPYEMQMMLKMYDEQQRIKAQVEANETMMVEYKETVSNVVETFTSFASENWRKEINGMVNKLAKEDGDFRGLRNRLYGLLEEKAGCKLNIRLDNMKSRMMLNGSSRTQADNKSKMDVIEEDKKLKEIFENIVRKEFARRNLI